MAALYESGPRTAQLSDLLHLVTFWTFELTSLGEIVSFILVLQARGSTSARSCSGSFRPNSELAQALHVVSPLPFAAL
jgi:hypothetical protein